MGGCCGQRQESHVRELREVCGVQPGQLQHHPPFLTPTPLLPITPECPGSWRKAGERAKMQALPEGCSLVAMGLGAGAHAGMG